MLGWAHRGLRGVGMLLLAGTLAWWLAAGAHRGWTMTSVPTRVLDEVTGIEAVVYEKRVVPGLDVVGSGAAVALVLIGLSFVGRRARTRTGET